MCGISGLIQSSKVSLPLDEIGKQMLRALEHRGPDSHGIWSCSEDGVMLGHRRLAIQDLSIHGHQPMWSKSKRFCLVYNGEIYNFKELLDSLTAEGNHFNGHSDTEVLLCAIENWGIQEAIRRSIGMFSLGLWDSKHQTMTLCRDRMGEKPLYYGWIHSGFCFASELKAIESIAAQKPLELDYHGLMKFTRYGYITAPHSIYKNIYKLIPGTIFTFKKREILEHRDFSPHANQSKLCPKTYWSVHDTATSGLENQINNDSEASETLENLLEKTTSRQMIADVNVGVFLSGGIDSSTVAALAQKVSSKRINTFSIGFEEQEYDESGYAAAIAKHLGTNHSSLNVLPSDTLNLVPDLPSIYDEPFADSSQIPMFIVSKFARSEVTVCLSGDGGDELFAGYNRYLSTQNIWGKIKRIPKPLRKIVAELLTVPKPDTWDSLYKLSQFNQKNGMESQKLIGLKVQKLAGLLKQENILEAYNYLLSYWNRPEDILRCNNPIDPQTHQEEILQNTCFINKAMYLDQIGYLEGDNLTKVDRASMSVSLETRLPLLSHELVELAWRIPVTMKYRHQKSKWILRQLLYKYVPKNLIDRPKMGFSVPVAKWLRSDLKSWGNDMISLAGCNGYEFISRDTIYKTWNEHQSGKRDHSQKLWTMLMLISWVNYRK